MELGNEVLDLEIKKSSYEFPELFYNIDLDPNQKELTISFDLNKTGQKCDECYLKIFSRDILRKSKPDYILIFAWSFFNEIIEKNIKYLHEGVKFINVFDENTNYIDEKINLSTSYTENNKKICYVQEGPNWWFNDYNIVDQFNFYNILSKCDIIFSHNEIDERLAAGWNGHSGQRKRYLKSIIKDKKE